MATKKMTISYRDRKRRRRAVKISSCDLGNNKERVDHAGEGMMLADRLYNDAPGGTVDHMLLRILGRMANEPNHVTSEGCKKKIRALQEELCAR